MKLATIMIVRNAEETLERMLDSVLGYTDDVLALMAGPSTDNTELILQDFDVLYEKVEWKDNFGLARNQLFDFVRKHTDWALLMDADDVLTNGRELRGAVEQLTGVGAYLHIRHGSMQYWQKRLFNLEVPGAWVGRAHEVYQASGKWGKVHQCEIVHQRGDLQSIRAKDRNLNILKKWMEEAPEEFDAHKYYNYGNELLWHRMWHDAARIYGLALGLPQWRDERYFTHIRRGVCLVQIQAWSQAWNEFVSAVRVQPEWRDSFLEMSRWFYHRGLHELCLHMDAYAQTKPKADTILPVNEANYTTIQDDFVAKARAALAA